MTQNKFSTGINLTGDCGKLGSHCPVCLKEHVPVYYIRLSHEEGGVIIITGCETCIRNAIEKLTSPIISKGFKIAKSKYKGLVEKEYNSLDRASGMLADRLRRLK